MEWWNDGILGREWRTVISHWSLVISGRMDACNSLAARLMLNFLAVTCIIELEPEIK
jgi:hypothetical protein